MTTLEEICGVSNAHFTLDRRVTIMFEVLGHPPYYDQLFALLCQRVYVQQRRIDEYREMYKKLKQQHTQEE
ncbi:MAG TPA: hypothetical protein PK916_08995 [Bacteroidota bacterium]|nr:hypothetical protein [Bacteroidota bacterium]